MKTESPKARALWAMAAVVWTYVVWAFSSALVAVVGWHMMFNAGQAEALLGLSGSVAATTGYLMYRFRPSRRR